MARYAQELDRTLSHDRLSKYGRPGDDLGTVTTYFWNVALCQALYPSLGALEVALRNAIHDTLTQRYETPWWFCLPSLLQRREEQEIGKAVIDVRRRRPVRPVTPGRVVAELSFGFWTSILDSAYGASLWAPHNPAIYVQQVFPYAPMHFQVRGRAHGRFNRIRKLRNRVLHYEPIWHWKDLDQQHADLIGAIGWISPTLQATIETPDQFPTIHQTGKPAIERALKNHLGIP